MTITTIICAFLGFSLPAQQSHPLNSQLKLALQQGRWGDALPLAESIAEKEDDGKMGLTLVRLSILTNQPQKAKVHADAVPAEVSGSFELYLVLAHLSAKDEKAASERLAKAELPKFARRILTQHTGEPELVESAVRISLAESLRKSGLHLESNEHLQRPSGHTELEPWRNYCLGLNYSALRQYPRSVTALNLALPGLPDPEARIAKDVIRRNELRTSGTR